jgi:hypothetical protein
MVRVIFARMGLMGVDEDRSYPLTGIFFGYGI